MATRRTRGRDRLDRRFRAEGPDPPLAELLAGTHPVWVVGGEPTLRADLPALLAGLGHRLEGLWTDGWALGRPEAVAALQDAGLRAVRIPFHSARAAAHDWLAGTPGAQRRTWQALRSCIAAGLQVDVEVVVTRPTLPHLEETLGLLARLRPHGIGLRPLEEDAPDYAAVAARWPQVRGPLNRAVALAHQADLRVWLEGFPHCAAAELSTLRVPGRPSVGRACGQCPGPPDCHGIAPAYLQAFGWQDVPAPPHRRDLVTVAILPGEATRTVRHRLVQAAGLAPTLRLLGLEHAEGPGLLAEALALSFDRVEASGRLDVVAAWGPRDKLRLRHLARLDGRWLGDHAEAHDQALDTPGAWDASWALLAEVAAQGVDVPSWPARFRFLRDEAVVQRAVPGLPPCLRPLGWDRGAQPPAEPSVAPTGTPCEHRGSCGAGERCPGLDPNLDPTGIGPL